MQTAASSSAVGFAVLGKPKRSSFDFDRINRQLELSLIRLELLLKTEFVALAQTSKDNLWQGRHRAANA